MIRQLLADDLPEAERLINENRTLQGREMPEFTRQYLIANATDGLVQNPDRKPYYGKFADDGYLLAMVNFEIWDPKDGDACTMALTCTTNSRPLERQPGYRWSQPILDVTTYGFDRMTELGIGEGYATRTLNPKWVTMEKEFIHGDKFNYAVMEEVPAFEVPKNPLYGKYVIKVPFVTPQLVIRFRRKDIE
jgi:hypothetical protein